MIKNLFANSILSHGWLSVERLKYGRSEPSPSSNWAIPWTCSNKKKKAQNKIGLVQKPDWMYLYLGLIVILSHKQQTLNLKT